MVRLVVVSLLLTGLMGCATTEAPSNSADDYSQYREGSEHPAVLMLFKQSDSAIQAGNWSAAMTYLDQARRIEPRNPYVLYRQAWASAQSGDTERARQLLERARVYVNKDDELLNYRLYELEFQINP